MPYITSYFMTRAIGDRPLVVPHQSQNLAFIGNFAETERDTVFTTEYSVRTAMEAVYQLLNMIVVFRRSSIVHLIFAS